MLAVSPKVTPDGFLASPVLMIEKFRFDVFLEFDRADAVDVFRESGDFSASGGGGGTGIFGGDDIEEGDDDKTRGILLGFMALLKDAELTPSDAKLKLSASFLFLLLPFMFASEETEDDLPFEDQTPELARCLELFDCNSFESTSFEGF